MTDFKSDPDIKIEVRKGMIEYSTNKRSIRLLNGQPWPNKRDSAVIRIHNLGERYLTVDKIKYNILGGTTVIANFKVSPGNNYEISGSWGMMKEKLGITNGTWHDDDPSPGKSGGKTDDERQREDLWKWIEDHLSWLILGGVSISVVLYLIWRGIRKVKSETPGVGEPVKETVKETVKTIKDKAVEIKEKIAADK